MDSIDLKHLPALLRITYQVLASRVLVFLALVMTFGLFCWSLATGSWVSLATSGTFAAFVFWPILLRGMRKDSSDDDEAT